MADLSDEKAEELRQRFMQAQDQKPVILESEPLIKVTLVPVEVFGTECGTCETEVGYGLSDAVGGLSDCNRAIGRIYRREDMDVSHASDDVITVYVPRSELGKFDRRYGES